MPQIATFFSEFVDCDEECGAEVDRDAELPRPNLT
jgi:hypothetical protein